MKRFTKAAVDAKRAAGTRNPIINVRTVVVRRNEPEIEEICSFARQAGADYYTAKSVSFYYDADPFNPELPADPTLRSFQYRGEEAAKTYRDFPNLCRKPWNWPTVR